MKNMKGNIIIMLKLLDRGSKASNNYGLLGLQKI